MVKPDETKRRDRRDFLKAAGGMAIALAAAKSAAAQAPNAKAVARPNNRRSGPTDRALWITWYDLPDSGRDDYFAWLHQTYLPNLLNRPGYSVGGALRHAHKRRLFPDSSHGRSQGSHRISLHPSDWCHGCSGVRQSRSKCD